MSVSIFKGSILDAPVDYIVNPANSFLRHGGGLARIIAEGAAPWPAEREYWDSDEFELALRSRDWRREQENHYLIATGDAAMTSAGELPFSGIIHAVGPVWGGGAFYERELLESAYIRALRIAQDHKGSVALPAISAGVFGMPIELVAQAAIRAVQRIGLNYGVRFALPRTRHEAGSGIIVI